MTAARRLRYPPSARGKNREPVLAGFADRGIANRQTKGSAVAYSAPAAGSFAQLAPATGNEPSPKDRIALSRKSPDTRPGESGRPAVAAGSPDRKRNSTPRNLKLRHRKMPVEALQFLDRKHVGVNAARRATPAPSRAKRQRPTREPQPRTNAQRPHQFRIRDR